MIDAEKQPSSGRRARWLLPVALLIGLSLLPLALARTRTGIADGKALHTWGRRGISPGRLQKPRAMAIDANDNIYVVDMTARIQVFDREGRYLRGWQTPAAENGRPTGMSFARDGNLMVADTHYYRILFYTPAGELLEERTLGGVMGYAPANSAWLPMPFKTRPAITMSPSTVNTTAFRNLRPTGSSCFNGADTATRPDNS